jgi:hypothetical protein
MSFWAFLKRKWYVVALLLFVMVYFARLIVPGYPPHRPDLFFSLVALGVVQVFIYMYLWMRLGRSAWVIILAWLILGAMERAILQAARGM